MRFLLALTLVRVLSSATRSRTSIPWSVTMIDFCLEIIANKNLESMKGKYNIACEAKLCFKWSSDLEIE